MIRFAVIYASAAPTIVPSTMSVKMVLVNPDTPDEMLARHF